MKSYRSRDIRRGRDHFLHRQCHERIVCNNVISLVCFTYILPLIHNLLILFRLPTLQPSETWNPRSLHLWKGKCSRCVHMITGHPGKYESIPAWVAITNASYTSRACHDKPGVYINRPGSYSTPGPQGPSTASNHHAKRLTQFYLTSNAKLWIGFLAREKSDARFLSVHHVDPDKGETPPSFIPLTTFHSRATRIKFCNHGNGQ